MIKTIIFDLDGTLTDTLGDLADAVNFVMRKNGYPTHEEEKFNYFVGAGSYQLIKNASPKGTSEEKLRIMVQEFFEYYGEHYLDRTRPYDKIKEALDGLRQKGIKLAVCSNKIQNMTDMVCEKFFSGVFSFVFGQTDRFPLKPDPSAPLWIAEQHGSSPVEVIFVGDSGSDMVTAKNGGFCGVGALWGFRTKEELLENGADYVIESPLELLEIIEKV